MDGGHRDGRDRLYCSYCGPFFRSGICSIAPKSLLSKHLGGIKDLPCNISSTSVSQYPLTKYHNIYQCN